MTRRRVGGPDGACPIQGCRADPGVTLSLRFDAPLEELLEYYRSIFPDLRLRSESSQSAVFEIAGQRFMAFSGGPVASFSEGMEAGHQKLGRLLGEG